MPRLAAGVLALVLCAGSAQARIDVKPQADGIAVVDDGKPVLFFRTKTPDPTQPGRLAYVHPIQAPDGTALTEDTNAAERGLFWAWPRVMLAGEEVADSWNLKGATSFVRATHFQGATDGSGALSFDIDWIVSSRPELVYVARETTRILVKPLAKGARRIEIDTVITPKVEGLAIAGDAAGDGGLALRLVRPDKLAFNAGKGTIAPGGGVVAAGPSMGFSWLAEPSLPAVSVGFACRVDGQAVGRWRLRRDAGAQVCVFPGDSVYAITKDHPLHLQSTLVIQPKRAAK